MKRIKHCKFNTTFRTNVYAVAYELGLQSLTTPKQACNGTLMFHDPQTDTKYSIHESGYVRRHIKGTGLFTQNSEEGYQLNRVDRIPNKYNSNGFSSKRILANPYEQLGILVKSVINFRNY